MDTTGQSHAVLASGEKEAPTIQRGVDLADVEAAILTAQNLDDWRREDLLASARALAAFYEMAPSPRRR